mmetsp:Transcript_61722/g.122136  ORF Transcript_61722/g.122136 Transcript_61722/m.122136 type:complete len:82 (-) Transcript_61722:585-830(-)
MMLCYSSCYCGWMHGVWMRGQAHAAHVSSFAVVCRTCQQKTLSALEDVRARVDVKDVAASRAQDLPTQRFCRRHNSMHSAA